MSHYKRWASVLLALGGMLSVLYMMQNDVVELPCVIHDAPLHEDAAFFHLARCDWSTDFFSDGCRNASAAALTHLGTQISRRPSPSCTLIATGKYGGNHMLCDVDHNNQCCTWLSFGIANDYSFDTQFHDHHPSCSGHLFDPSVSYPAQMTSRMFFYKMGLRSVRVGDPRWVLASLPAVFRMFVGRAQLAVLKMDCEGCEYQVAQTVADEFPRLFARVDQIAFEAHVSRAWMRSESEMFAFGMLIHMLEREGMVLQHVSLEACGQNDEGAGCLAEFLHTGMPCAPHSMCHNYLFARIPNKK